MDSGTRKLLREYSWTVLIAVAAALLIRFYVIEAYRIPAQSMRPTLEPGDTVFVAKSPAGTSLLSGSGAPTRGEVILYSTPDSDKRDYIKRVIGVPGDTLQYKDGKLLISGMEIPVRVQSPLCNEELLPGVVGHTVCTEPPMAENFGPIKVPSGTVFVIGDLRTAPQMESSNSGKTWGLIPVTAIRGKVLWIWLSVEPGSTSVPSGWFPKFRFERMFRRVE